MGAVRLPTLETISSPTSGPVPRLYMLWAEGSSVFKIGFTTRSISLRASEIEASSPLPLRVVASRFGSREDEQAIHARLRTYRTHGEWFSLPEAIVWHVLAWFGVVVTEGAT